MMSLSLIFGYRLVGPQKWAGLLRERVGKQIILCVFLSTSSSEKYIIFKVWEQPQRVANLCFGEFDPDTTLMDINPF